MAFSPTLTPDLEQALAQEASDRGTTPRLLALESLRQRFVGRRAHESSTQTASSLAEFLDGRLGARHSSEHVPGGARMSEDCGKKFTAALVEEQRADSRR